MLVKIFSYKQTFQSLYIRRVPIRIYYIRFADRVYYLLQAMQLVLFRLYHLSKTEGCFI